MAKSFLARGQTADPNPSKKQKPGQKLLQIDIKVVSWSRRKGEEGKLVTFQSNSYNLR